MEDYLLALFSAVEAKRPVSVPDKADKDWKGSNPSLDRLEPVKKESFKFDLGSAQKKKRLGGMRKIFAEWLLIAGLPYPACQYFAQAVDMLQSAKAILPLAAALEGLSKKLLPELRLPRFQFNQTFLKNRIFILKLNSASKLSSKLDQDCKICQSNQTEDKSWDQNGHQNGH